MKQTYVINARWVRGPIEDIGIVIRVYCLTETVLMRVISCGVWYKNKIEHCYIPSNGASGIHPAR